MSWIHPFTHVQTVKPSDTDTLARMTTSQRLQLGLVSLGLAGLAIAVWDVTMGGFYFIVLGIRVSSWEAYKPFRIGMVAMIAAFWLNDRISAPDRTSWRMLPRWAPWIAAGIAVASVAIAIRFGIFAAGGADSYGYVSQASLWAEGRLVVPDPLAEVESVLGLAVAPLGYLRARTRARSFRPIRLACRWRWRSR